MRTGGPIGGPRRALVGEHGPEMSVPRSVITFNRAAVAGPDVIEISEPARARAMQVQLPDGEIPVRGVLIVESVETGDARIIDEGALTWRDLPLPIMASLVTSIGHDGAFLAGRLEELTRDGTLIRFTGMLDESDDAREVARHIAIGNVRGISADLDMVDADIEVIEDESPLEDEGDVQELPDLRLVVHEGRVMGGTIVPFPAFQEAFIEIDWDRLGVSREDVIGEEAAAAATGRSESTAAGTGAPVVAAGAPVRPPAGWFADPQLADLTPLTITDDGRVYGHIAPWGQCHIGIADVCVTPSPSPSGYAYFCTGCVVCDDGSEVPVGQITMGTGHADLSMSLAAAVEHYDNTGTVAADVACGEDAYGIWVAGALRPELTDRQVRQLRAASPSGDWRAARGHRELVAVLAVNVPGFPVPRARAHVANGHQTALVAAGAQQMIALRDPLRRHLAELAARVEMVEEWRAEQEMAALRRRIVDGDCGCD